MMPRSLADAFDVHVDQYGGRGDLHLWHAMRERLAGVPVPEGEDAVRAAYVTAFNEIVGVDLDTEPERRVFRKELDHGGMSGGVVDLEWWRSTGLPLLVEEARR